MKQPTSIRLSDLTTRQLADLVRLVGTNQSEVIAIAIDRMHREEQHTMNAKHAHQLAEEAVAHAEGDSGTPVAGTTHVGISDNGYYWVTDNGEEVGHLTREQAIEIIVENLTATNE